LPLGELSSTYLTARFTSAIRSEAELYLPDPMTSENDPMVLHQKSGRLS